MKKDIETPCFSCGTDAGWWIENNCDTCIKGQKYNAKTDDWGKIKCSIQNDIFTQWLGSGTEAISRKTYDATRQATCPYKATEYPKKKKKTDEKQMNLFN